MPALRSSLRAAFTEEKELFFFFLNLNCSGMSLPCSRLPGHKTLFEKSDELET